MARDYTDQLETLLAIDGSDEETGPNNAKTKRFPPMMTVPGPFQLAADKPNTHKLEIPPYLGEVRLMMVAGNGRAFGSADAQVFVRKPIMLYTTLPRLLTPKDRLDIPITVFTTRDNIRKVEV